MATWVRTWEDYFNLGAFERQLSARDGADHTARSLAAEPRRKTR